MLSFVSKINLRTLLLASLVPLIVIVFWFGKNYLLFNSFSSSTSFGMNLARITTDRLNISEKNILINQGILSPISTIPPFSFLNDYRRFIVTEKGSYNTQRNIPVLFNEKKSSRSKVSWFSSNFNHIDYIEISNRYKMDAYNLIINSPKFYLRQTYDAVKIFFKPSSHHFGVKWSYKKIKKYCDIYNAIFLGCVKKFSTLALWSIAFYVFVTFYLLYIILIKKKCNLDRKDPHYIIIYFLVFNIFYNFFISNLFEFGENNRFSFCISPLSVILFGLIISRYLPSFTHTLKQITGRQ
jgi:hypothetical protein